MTTPLETVPLTRTRIKRRSSNRPLAENLFGKRFSALTIEEEYNYNLEYLLSQNGPTRWVEKNQTVNNFSAVDSKIQPEKCIPDPSGEYHVSRETPLGNYRSRLNQVDNRQSKPMDENEVIPRYTKPKIATNSKSTLNKNSAVSVPIVFDPVDVDGRKKIKQKFFSGTDGTIHIERVQPTRPAVVAAHQTSDSVYPGLHIYVTESPPRPYYDVISSFEPTKTHPSRKTVACDPITPAYSVYPQPRSVKITHPIPERERDEQRNKETKGNPLRKSFEQIEPHSVASRVEAFMALLQPKEQKRPSETNYVIRATPLIPENRITSPSEMTEYCFTCCKRIYPVDRVSIGDRVYHKGCFRCATCQRIVLPGNFASLDGIILCKPHYIEQFRLSGRYELRPFSIKNPNFEHSSASSPILER